MKDGECYYEKKMKVRAILKNECKNKTEASVENGESALNANRSNCGSSLSLDSKDSKNCKTIPTVQIEEIERKWYRHSSRCNLEQLKIILETDNELINKKDYFTGFAAVHWAAKKGRHDIISWLFQQNADTNLRNNGGYTPLHIATMHKRESAIQKLVYNFNADINIRDYSGKKPRHYLTGDFSASVKRILQETPSVIEMITDPNAELVSTDGFMTPTVIRRERKALHQPTPLTKTVTTDDGSSGTKKVKEKRISLSHSFKLKKKSLHLMKRPLTISSEHTQRVHDFA